MNNVDLKCKFMVAQRRSAFKKKFGREACFTNNIDKDSGFPKDFMDAQALVCDKDQYAIFDMMAQELHPSIHVRVPLFKRFLNWFKG